MRTEEQTDRERDMTKLIVHFRKFAKAPLKTQKLVNAPQLCSGGLWYQRCLIFGFISLCSINVWEEAVVAGFKLFVYLN